MKRKFIYNPNTCQYEPVYLTGKVLFKKLSIFISLSLLVATGIFAWYINNFLPVKEQYLQQANASLKGKWELLYTRIENAHTNLDALAKQDDSNYRVILDLPALSEDVRSAGVGGAEPSYVTEVKQYPLIADTYKKVEKLTHQIDVERQSYEELIEVADTRLNMWASRPAIQPVSNKQLNRLHTTYGSRVHPIFNTVKDHKGLDFSAPRGTPVYATGDGRISMAHFSGSYGNVVYVDHGFDFETRYAHLNRFIVHQGEFVKRGQVIGYVGNTGISASPHLHYEVLFKGVHTNPINFFQRDLNNTEYEKLIKITDQKNYPLD
jgi:murein DD-endopeptidase MepM/ murein hydrolase activator NlpD